MARPTITIVHQLPGRIRLRFSHGLKQPEQAITRVKALNGVLSAEYTAISKSFLVRFLPMEISSEKILIRVALCLSLDHSKTPVRILAQPDVREWSDSPFFSALALIAAGMGRLIRSDPKTTLALDWIAGLSTAGAVLHHGWLELRRKGYYDPEVLSVVYLAAAFIRGQFITASLVTWFSTFGRHILKPPPRAVELRVTQSRESSGGTNRYGIIVSVARDDNRMTNFSRLVPALIQHALIGGTNLEDDRWLSDVRHLVTIQDEVLLDIGHISDATPGRIRRIGAT